MMKRLLLLFSLFLYFENAFTQSVLIDPAAGGGFESGTFTDNGWTATVGSSNPRNNWFLGTNATAGFSGSKCAYISRNNSAHQYNNSNARVSHLSKTISVPSGESSIELSFLWIGDGETGYDYLTVWVVPTSFIPLYGTLITSSSDKINISGELSGITSWQTLTLALPSNLAGTNFKLVFQWQNDGNTGDNPPAAIDDVSLKSQCPLTELDVLNTNSNICPGSITHLTTNGWDVTSATLINEDFSLPVDGWLQSNSSVGGTPANAAWAIYTDGDNGIHSNDNSDFVMSDSDAQGLGGTTYTILYAPTIDLTNFTTVNLKFYQYYNDYNSYDEASVQISVDGGNSWSKLVVYTSDQGSSTSFLETNISLDSYIGFNDVRIRFEYYAVYGYYWAIDNVSITGTRPNIIWTATPAAPNTLFTDAICSMPYTAGNHANDVYVNPSSTTIYTAIASNGSCSKTDTVTLTVETATYNGSWTPALSSNQSIEINADYTLANDLDVCACKVNATKKLTIPATISLTVQNAIENNGEIIIENTGSLVQVNETDTNTGSGVYKIKKTTGTYKNYDYFYWASPVENETVGSVFPTVNYKYKFNPDNYLDTASGHGYPQPTASAGDGYDDDGYDWTYINNSYLMPKGIGFIAMGIGSPNNFSVGQMGVSQVAFDATFEGEKIHNGTFTAEVKQDAYSPGFNANNNNLNLLGNPYPSAIDVFELYHDNASVLKGEFYFWTHDAPLAAIGGPNTYDFNNNNFAIGTITGTYPAYTYTKTLSGTGKSAPQYIASTQGFMASVIDGISNPANVSYKNSMRVAGDNTTFLKQVDVQQEADRIWLNLTSESNFSQIAIGFDATTEDTYGRGDTPRIDSANATDFYSLVPNDWGHYAIQFLSEFNDSKMIPLGIEIQYSGNYQISLDHFDGIFTQGQAIYLEDTYENVIHDLGMGAYTFTQTAGANINNRFVLRFTNSALSNEETALNQVKVYPNPSAGVFNVAYYGTATLQYTVYDLTGKTVFSGTGNQINLTNQAIGMYFAKITDGKSVRTVKLVKE